jgi:hypothetical protein
MKRDRVILGDEDCGELTPGGLYFNMGYPQPGVNLPQITTLVYLGEEISDGSDGEEPHPLYVFQRADSYQALGDWFELPAGQARETSLDALVGFPAGLAIGVCDLAGLIHRLQRLQQRMNAGLSWEQALPQPRPTLNGDEDG